MDEVRVYRVDDYEDDDFSSLDQGKRDVIREIEMEDMEAGRSIDTLIWIEEAYEVENRGEMRGSVYKGKENNIRMNCQ